MRTKRETKQNPDLQNEFKTTRFLWHLAESWFRAKKENTLDIFWTGLENMLKEYDTKNPTGRRNTIGKHTATLNEPSATSKVSPATMKKPSAILNEPSAILTNESPAILNEQSAMNKPSAILNLSGTTPVKQGPREPERSATRPRLPKPSGDPSSTVLTPSPSVAGAQPPTVTRPVPSMAEAGPSRPRPPTPSATRPVPSMAEAGPSRPRVPTSSSTSSLTTGYSTSSTLRAILNENGYVPLRITPAFSKSKSKIRPAKLSGNSDYLPSIQVKHENKGTRKRKQPVDKGPESGTKRRRKSPKPTGDIRNPPCKRCREKDLTCYSQEGGNACVSCAKIKIRCSTKAVVKRDKKPAVVNNARPETSKHIGQSPPSRPSPIPRPLTRRPSWPIPVPRPPPRPQVYKTDDLLLSSSPAASPERNVERPELRPVLQLAQERRPRTRSKVDEVKRYTTEEKGKGK
jgi:hypothetical protein